MRAFLAALGGRPSRRGVRRPAHPPRARTAARRRRGAGGPLADALAGGDPDAVFAAVPDELAAAPPDRARDRGRALGRRRDVGRPAVRRPPHRRPARRARADATATTRSAGTPVAARPRRARRAVGAPLSCGGSPGGGLGAGGRTAARRWRCTADRGQPVLRHRGARPRAAARRSRPRSSTPCSPGCAARPGAPAALDQLAVVPSAGGACRWLGLIGDVAPIADAERAGVLEVGTDAVAFRHELARRAVAARYPWPSACSCKGAC